MTQEENFYADTAVYFLTNRFGVVKPSKKQIDEMKSILFNAWLKRSISLDKKLTDKEKTCLFLASQGKTYKQIAQMLAISPSTVKSHKKEILRKLSCHNMQQAIAVGIRYGHVSKL